MPRIKSDGASPKYHEVLVAARNAGIFEQRDCAVVAVAAVTGLPYPEVHAAMKAAGRKDRKGTPFCVTRKCLEQLGFEVKDLFMHDIIATYPSPHNNLRSITSHHPERFAKVWPKGAFLLHTRGHVLAIVDGVNCDWSKGQSLRGNSIYRVTKRALNVI